MKFTPEGYARMSPGEQMAVTQWLRVVLADQEEAINIAVIECETPYRGRIGYYVVTDHDITTEWFKWEAESPFPYFLEEGYGG